MSQNIQHYLDYKMSQDEKKTLERLVPESISEKIDGKLIYVTGVGFVKLKLDNEWKMAEEFPEQIFSIAKIKVFFPLYFRKIKDIIKKKSEVFSDWNDQFIKYDARKMMELITLESLQRIFSFDEIKEDDYNYFLSFFHLNKIIYVRKQDFVVIAIKSISQT